MKRLRLRQAAIEDVLEGYAYLSESASITLAGRFLKGFEAACSQLQKHPFLGGQFGSADKRLAGMRRRSVPGFAKFLIFYQVQSDAVDIVRVLHGARDVQSILEE
ncbi:MAG: type II toxin-antitoxin system RelE/ParE family toxin [Acidobacteriaceae bacterium]